MKIQEILKSADIPRSEAEILMAHVLEQDKTFLLAHGDDNVADTDIIKIQNFFRRRKNSEPIAYIKGHKEFYGHDFIVNKNVLIPRPSTEYLIDAASNFILGNEVEKIEADTQIVIKTIRLKDALPSIIVDIGTGSGCIAVTLALKHPRIHIIATDISNKALDIARLNARIHGMDDRIDFRHGDMLDPISDITQPFLLVSNPPYIPEGDELMPDVENFEPRMALRGGEDGGDIVRAIIRKAKASSMCVGVCIECRAEQVLKNTLMNT